MLAGKLVKNNNDACWRRNGVWGDITPRCEKLEQVKHCRNCEVFEKAALDAIHERRRNLEGDLNFQSIEELIEKEKLAGDKSVLPFRLGDKTFAVASTSIVTVSDQVSVHGIPHNPNSNIDGLVAINHEIYLFISLHRLLGVPEDPRGNEKDNGTRKLFKRILVVDFGNRIAAFYVDEVYKIHRYFDQDVKLPENNSKWHRFIKGVLPANNSFSENCMVLNLGVVSNLFGKNK